MGKENRRSIDTSFWTDPEVELLSKDATYLFNALLSFPENNMAGTFEISEAKMSYYTKLDHSEINQAFKELETKNKVLRFKTWVSIKNHIKNQRLNGGMAISVVKDLCECPNPVKLWLFYRSNSETLEAWFPKLLFNVNAYMSEQKKRAINRTIKGNPQITLIEASSELEYKPLTEDQLMQIMVQDLPLDTKELSNLTNLITLIEWLDNPSMNIKINKKYKREIEDKREDIKGKIENEDFSSPTSFDSYIPPDKKNKINFYPPPGEDFGIPKNRLTDMLEYWNEKIPKEKLPSTFNIAPDQIAVNFISTTEIEHYKICVDNYSKAYDFNTSRLAGFRSTLKPDFLMNWYSPESVENCRQRSGFGKKKESDNGFDKWNTEMNFELEVTESGKK